jgi:hypothetical protein
MRRMKRNDEDDDPHAYDEIMRVVMASPEGQRYLAMHEGLERMIKEDRRRERRAAAARRRRRLKKKECRKP